MSEYMNNLPDPEEFWPDAEKMLNGHFQAKRRRRAVLWLAVFFLTVSTVFVLTREDEQVSADRSSAAETLTVSSDYPPVEEKTSAAISENTSAQKTAGQDPTTPPDAATHQVATVITGQKSAAQPSTPTKNKKQRPGVYEKNISDNLTTSSQPVRTNAITNSAPVAVIRDQDMKSPSSGSVPFTETFEQTLTPIRFLSAQAISLQQEQSLSISGKQEVKPLPKLKSKMDLIAYAGMNYVDKVINSPGNTIYMQRREAEESATFLPYLGAQIAKSVSKFEIRAGAEFSVLGERVNYSPYRNGEYYNSYLDWDPYSYTVTDTDSAWIFGMLFLQTNSYQVNDSLQVTVTDTLNGRHYDASILEANGTNRWYLIQFPMEMSYTIMRGPFGIGISGGIAPGLVIGSSGKYLMKDESGVREISRENRGNFMLSVGGGIEFSYQLGDKCSIMLRPTARYFITPVEEENGASKNYRTIGLQTGIRYRIR